ncbi:hypothetical protein Tco_0255102 [Tanacetum coccineum]
MKTNKFRQTNRFMQTNPDSSTEIRTEVDEERIQADRCSRQTYADRQMQIQHRGPDRGRCITKQYEMQNQKPKHVDVEMLHITTQDIVGDV